jgi:hypothetical protein
MGMFDHLVVLDEVLLCPHGHRTDDFQTKSFADPAVNTYLVEGPRMYLVARGYGHLPEVVEPDAAGARSVELKQGERIELRVPRGFETVYQIVNGQQRALPIGSTWDAGGGTFSWQPAPGFFGRYRFVFSNGRGRINVRVVVLPE